MNKNAKFGRIFSSFSKNELLENQLRSIQGGYMNTCAGPSGNREDFLTDSGSTVYIDDFTSECDANCSS